MGQTGPSYAFQSRNITTVLQELCVRCPGSSETLIATQPPYLVVGSANESFLARVELIFNGLPNDQSQQTAHFEHWIEVGIADSISSIYAKFKSLLVGSVPDRTCCSRRRTNDRC